MIRRMLTTAALSQYNRSHAVSRPERIYPPSMNKSTSRSSLILKLFMALGMLVVTHVQAAGLAEGKAAYLARDYAEALRILLPLASQGDPKAQVILGIMYDYGQGVPKDSAKALEWYKEAALGGIAVAQQALGGKYFLGQDYQEAARWWRLAAANGLAESQYNLGVLYAKGLGVQKDYNEAALWYRKAAEQGQAQAQYSLANLYARGLGVEANYSEAAQWYRKAAEQGLPQAQYNLGVLLENGRGIESDPQEAIQWYRLAAGWGLAQAHQKLAILEGSSPPPASAPAPLVDDQGLIQVRREPTNPEGVFPPSPPPEHPVTVKGGVKREAWIKAQNPEHFTLQISTASSEQAIIDLIKDQERGAYFKRKHNGKFQYTAIYGVFKSHDSAVKARATLPSTMQKLEPWVRKFAAVQKLLLP